MKSEYQEQLTPAESGGAAYAESSDAGTTVRIAPIKEGDRTVGHRPGSDDTEPTLWDREPVKEAVESGALDGSTIVKGRGGKNPHYSFDEQVPADAVLGKVDSWEYEDGVGPVGKAQLADEGIADRIELDLLDVSGDWLRRLGEFDADRGGNPVDEVIGLPRVTVVERGASNASIDIESETAEALGYNPDAQSVDEPAESGTDDDDDNETPDMGSNNDNELREQLAEVRTERNDLDDKVDTLEDETDDLEEQLAEKKSTIEEKDDKIDNLEEEYGPIKELLAEIAVGDSPLEPEKVAEMHSGQELVEMLAEDVEDADDKSYSDMVKEQLGAPLDPRGKGEEENGPVDDEVNAEEAEQLAESVMTASDKINANGSNADYLAEQHGVNISEHVGASNPEKSLRTALRNGGDN